MDKGATKEPVTSTPVGDELEEWTKADRLLFSAGVRTSPSTSATANYASCPSTSSLDAGRPNKTRTRARTAHRSARH